MRLLCKGGMDRIILDLASGGAVIGETRRRPGALYEMSDGVRAQCGTGSRY